MKDEILDILDTEIQMYHCDKATVIHYMWNLRPIMAEAIMETINRYYPAVTTSTSAFTLNLEAKETEK